MSELITNELEILATEINKAHQEVNNQFKYTLNNAIYAGEKLIEAKARCGHGNWMGWHEENIRHDIRTSATYMMVAENKGLLLSNWKKISNLSIDAALKLEREEKQK